MTTAVEGDLPSAIGRFEVKEVLGYGGFAVVARAYDPTLRTDVAIKVLLREFVGHEVVEERFRREARLLRRVNNPHVVAVYEAGELPGRRPYFVMELARGGTIDGRIGAGMGATGRDLLPIVDALESGLSALHAAGIVHRDVKPENLLFIAEPGKRAEGSTRLGNDLTRPGERIIISDLGIAKDHKRTTGPSTITGGSAYFRAPEQAKRTAEISPATDVYAATALLWNVMSGTEPPEVGQVGAATVDVDPVWQDFFRRGMATDPEHRFQTITEWAEDARRLVLLDRTAGFDGRRPTTAGCPFKGLASFEPGDAEMFFGREALIGELVARLEDTGQIVIGGASGSGKSSVVRAGLVPALRRGVVADSDRWPIALMTPGVDPLLELTHHLGRLGLPSVAPSNPDLSSAVEAARDADLVLVIDQFEEVFTLTPVPERERFLAVLRALTSPADAGVRLVIAVRADFYDRMASVPWLAECVNRSQVLVGPMAASELRRAIEGPAAQAGLALEPGLVDAIIDDGGTDPGGLPLIAHALVETWERRTGNRLTLEGYHDAGGVAGAIAQTAERLFNGLEGHDQATLRRLFLQLVQPGDGAADTRRRVARGDLQRDDAFGPLVDRLVDARLVTIDESTVGVAHEAIISSWPRLREWIDANREDLRRREQVARASAEWSAAADDPDLLWRGAPLVAAVDWLDRLGDDASTESHRFVDASVAARDRAETEAALAETARQRNRRRAIGALGLLAVAAVVASVVALISLRQSRSNEREAQQATEIAEQRLARSLAAVAEQAAGVDPLKALMLAVEGEARGTSAPGLRGALVTARAELAQRLVVPAGDPIAVGDVLTIALTSDGALLATGSRSGALTLWDTATRRPLVDLAGHTDGIEEIVFGADGLIMASADVDGKVLLWDVSDPATATSRVVADSDRPVWSVAISPDQTQLATAGEDGTVRLFDAVSLAETGLPIDEPSIDFLTVRFSPDGRFLVGGTGAGSVYVVDLATNALDRIIPAHTSDVWEFVFADEGDVLITVSSDGTARRWQLSTGGEVDRPFARDEADPFDVSISGVGVTGEGVVVGGGEDGRLWAWWPTSQRWQSTVASHRSPVTDLASAVDAQLMASLAGDQTVRLWSVVPEQPLVTDLVQLPAPAYAVAAAPNGSVAVGLDDGTVEVLDRAGASIAKLGGHSGRVLAVAFGSQGAEVATGDSAGLVRRFDAATGQPLATAMYDGSAVVSAEYAPDGSTVLIASASGAVRLVDATTLDELEVVTSGATQPRMARFSRDGTRILIVSFQRLQVFDGSALITENTGASEDVVASVDANPSGTLIAIAGEENGVVEVFDVTDVSAPIARLSPHAGGALDVHFVDDATIAVVSRAGQLRLWDARSATPLGAAFEAHDGAIWRLDVVPGTSVIVTAGADGWVRVFDMFDPATACLAIADRVDPRQIAEFFEPGELTGCG